MAEKKTGGLEGVIAGATSISTVGKEGVGLTYRGYSIEDLASHSTFEDVAYLLTLRPLAQQRRTGRLQSPAAQFARVASDVEGSA